MRMDEQRKNLKKYVAGFGAALAATAAVPEADAGIVPLTPNPTSLAFSDGTLVNLGIGPEPYDFFQTNDTEGKTLYGVSYDATDFNIASFVQAQFSQLITSGLSFITPLVVSYSAAGTATYAFRTKANQFGWIRMNLGGPAGIINYLAAAFNDTPGGTIGAGKLAVPEPSSAALAGLGALALGALGVRRLRNSDRS